MPVALAAVVVQRELVVRQAPQGKVAQVDHLVQLWAAVAVAVFLPQVQHPWSIKVAMAVMERQAALVVHPLLMLAVVVAVTTRRVLVEPEELAVVGLVLLPQTEQEPLEPQIQAAGLVLLDTPA